MGYLLTYNTCCLDILQWLQAIKDAFTEKRKISSFFFLPVIFCVGSLGQEMVQISNAVFCKIEYTNFDDKKIYLF